MTDDEVSMLRGVLSAHRSMLMGALSTNRNLDIDRAFHVHAGLSKILCHWDEFNVNEHREIVRTVEYLVNPEDDDVNDLTSPDGFADDLAELRKLQDFLGYV
jgi:hypothetical protein